MPVRPLGCARHDGHARRCGEGVHQCAFGAAVHGIVGDVGREQWRQIRDNDVHVARQPPQRRLPRRDGALQQLPQRLYAGGADHRGREHWHPAQAVVVQESFQVVDAALHVVIGQQVRLVEQHHRDVAVPVELREILLVHQPIGVLLRVEHPHDQVHECEQAIHLDPVGLLDRVEVGQVQQHQTPQRRVFPAVERSLPAVAPRRGHAEPVEQLLGAAGAPDAGMGRARGRPEQSDLRQIETRQSVEETGLAAARRSGQRHDRVLTREGKPLARRG